MNICKCNRCGRKVQGQPRNWKKLMQQFGGLGQLKANYVCSKCRHWQRDNPLLWAFTMSKVFRQLRWDIKFEMNRFETNEYNEPFPQRADTFKRKVDAIMAKRFIKNYNFVVEANQLHAILVSEVPFIGSFKIDLYETNKKEEQTETQQVQ
jgi:hypothetical protein